MTPTAANHLAVGVGPTVLVAERAGDGAHLVVAAYVDPAREVALRGVVGDVVVADGLWCGPGAASPRCRDGLIRAATSGGVSAVVIDAVGFDTPAQARAACLRAVVTDAEEVGVDWLLLARDDTHAATDTAGAAELARVAGASPTLRCGHADAGTEPLVVVAEVVAWCWTHSGAHRRAVAPVLVGVRLV